MGGINLSDSIFLSASVPDPKRAPEFANSSNSVAITSAVRALIHVTLGRRVLVWGGHPAITPMIKVVAQEMGIDYGKWVKLYQSKYFEDQFPEDNQAFKNIIYTENIENDPEKSLLHMRERMFEENTFKAAVFIGGMGGIIEELKLFQKHQPEKDIIPVISTGGAAIKVAELTNKQSDNELCNELDYVRLFHTRLSVSTKEERFTNPDEQPEKVDDRYWKSK